MDYKSGRSSPGTVGAIWMMALMMICCVGVLFLFALIPLVGWPLGIALVGLGAVAMLLFHQRFMGHGPH